VINTCLIVPLIRSRQYSANCRVRKRNCWDNAVSESFFHSLKTELIHHQTYQTRSEAKQAVLEYIEVFYNRERLHSANGYLSPVDYEAQLKAA
jgi:putative transposase